MFAFVILKDGVTDSEEVIEEDLKKLIRNQIGSFAVPQGFLVGCRQIIDYLFFYTKIYDLSFILTKESICFFFIRPHQLVYMFLVLHPPRTRPPSANVLHNARMPDVQQLDVRDAL